MKKLIILLTILILPSLSSAADWKDDWSINGMSLKQLSHPSKKEFLQFGAGIVTSTIVHSLSHVLYLEATGKDWHMTIQTEYCEDLLNDSQGKMFARSGMLGQLLVGTVLNRTQYKETHFVTGYHFGSFVQIAAYPLMYGNKGDLHFINDRGGNADLEYGIYTLWSGILLIDKED